MTGVQTCALPIYAKAKNTIDLQAQVTQKDVYRLQKSGALTDEFKLGAPIIHADLYDFFVKKFGDKTLAAKAYTDAGYDSIKFSKPDGEIGFALFDKKQVKSAIGNSGKFDPNSGSLTDNPIADWGAGLKKALDDMRAEFEKSKPKQPKAPADTAQAAIKTVAEASTFNPAALATQASDLLSSGKPVAQVIGELEAGGTKVSPELQNMLVGASEFGGRINDLVDQVKALQAQRGVNAQGDRKSVV